MTKITKERQEECKNALLELLKPGDTVYCQLKHVSRSGMYRVINLFAIKDNQPVRLSRYAADLLEGYDYRHEGCKASGCGMDMGFHLVYNLGCILWADGWECAGKKCPSNDHVNDWKSPRGEGVIHKHGYALRCQWM